MASDIKGMVGNKKGRSIWLEGGRDQKQMVETAVYLGENYFANIPKKQDYTVRLT